MKHIVQSIIHISSTPYEVRNVNFNLTIFPSTASQDVDLNKIITYEKVKLQEGGKKNSNLHIKAAACVT